MKTSIEELENWIEDIRTHELPDFRHRLRVILEIGNCPRDTQAEIALMECILESHDLLTEAQIDRAERTDLLDSVHRNIERCGHLRLESVRKNVINECLLALSDIANRFRLIDALT
jgi:hypothetical protein